MIFLIAVGFFTSPLSFADFHDGDGGDSKYSDEGDVQGGGDTANNNDPNPPGMITKELLGHLDHKADWKKFLEQKEALEKEKLQLDKEQSILNQELELLRIQIFDLSLTIEQFKNNDVSPDKIEELEEQLSELEFDKNDLDDSKIYLQERQDAYDKNLKIHLDSIPVIPNLSDNLDVETTSIPPWFKSNAKWWNEGLISDGDIINALESLIIQDIIPLDNFINDSPRILYSMGGILSRSNMANDGVPVDRSAYIASPHYGDPKPYAIPSYQKDVFGFWSDGQVSDSEIVDSIGHLMSQGIINSAKIQGEIAERQAKFDQKMAELDAVLDSDSKFMDKLDGADGSTTVINSDGSKTVTFEDETSTTFYTDGSRVKYSPHYDQAILILPFTDDANVERVTKVVTDSDGAIIFWEFTGPAANLEKLIEQYDVQDSLSITSAYDKFDAGIQSGEIPKTGIQSGTIPKTDMQQLIQVTALVIDGIHFPISQFTMWKWTGECDDAWHFHTPTTQAISIDGVTGITDPDQENCGFGKVGEVKVSTTFMSQEQIKKFRDRTDSDPLTNEAMTGGSDDVASPIDTNPDSDESTQTDVNPGPVSVEESDNGVKITSKKSTLLTDYDDWDGDGIADVVDDSPYLASTKFGTLGNGLPGEIHDLGGLEVRIIGGEGFGTVSFEITDNGSMFKTYEDGEEPYAIIEIMGIEFEATPGIYEFSFG